jgi:hypothetical protein
MVARGKPARLPDFVAIRLDVSESSSDCLGSVRPADDLRKLADDMLGNRGACVRFSIKHIVPVNQNQSWTIDDEVIAYFRNRMVICQP